MVLGKSLGWHFSVLLQGVIISWKPQKHGYFTQQVSLGPMIPNDIPSGHFSRGNGKSPAIVTYDFPWQTSVGSGILQPAGCLRPLKGFWWALISSCLWSSSSSIPEKIPAVPTRRWISQFQRFTQAMRQTSVAGSNGITRPGKHTKNDGKIHHFSWENPL